MGAAGCWVAGRCPTAQRVQRYTMAVQHKQATQALCWATATFAGGIQSSIIVPPTLVSMRPMGTLPP